MKKTAYLLFIIFSLSICLAHDKNKSHYVYLQDPNDLINPNGFYEYRIIKNDHLTKLANKFYHNGLKWPNIYKANPYVLDPNWIYPDNWLVIPEIFTDETGNPIITSTAYAYKSNESIIANSSSVKDQNNKGSRNFTGIDTDLDGHDDGYDVNNDGIIDVKTNFGTADSANNIIDTTDTAEVDIYPAINFSENIQPDSINIKDEFGNSILTPETNDTAINKEPGSNIHPSSIITKSTSPTNQFSDDNPNWVIGLFGGYPFGDIPNDDTKLDFGLLIGTPLRVTIGSLSARLGGGVLGFNSIDKLYPGAGLLLNLSISELLNLTTPVQLQIHGTGFYWPDGGTGTGVIGSTSVPLGKSPLNLGLYVGAGTYKNSDSINNSWKNAGIMLQIKF